MSKAIEPLLQRLKAPIHQGKEVFIAPNATTIGSVFLGNEVSIWFGAVLRGDTDQIRVGDRTNIQDNAVIHADPGEPCTIGSNCIIGHSAIVHGASIADHVLIGMHATVLNNANIGAYSIIGANALVPAGMVIPPFSLVLGVPAKIVKVLDESVKQRIQDNVDEYVLRSKTYIQYYTELNQ